MTLRSASVVLAAVLLLCSCANIPLGAASSGDDEATRAELLQADHDFNAATQMRGREGARAFLADEFRVFGVAPLGVGPDALLDAWKPQWEGQAKLTWEPDSATYLPQAGIGITTGRWKHETAAGTRVGRYTTFWRRQPDGSWKAIADGGCPDCLRCEQAPAASSH